MINALIVDAKTYSDILNDVMSPTGTKKIAAIKRLRRSVIGQDMIGLREAKDAVERLCHEKGVGDYPHAMKTGAMICVGPRVKKITVDFGNGDIEVDVERMELIALTQLQRIGLDACGQILELVTAIKAFSDGKRIGVIDNE